MQDNPRTTAIKAVAKANNLELNVVAADLQNPTIEHLKANKLGKVPAFLGEDGFALSECIAIAIYSRSTQFFFFRRWPRALHALRGAFPVMTKQNYFTVIPG